MRSYLEFIQEDTAAQRLYKKKGYFYGMHGPARKGDEKLIDYVENKEKASMMEKLEQYKDNENVYISFRRDPLVGVNPKSPYNTPNGVYCYPLKQIWHKVISNRVEFASERPFVGVIKIKEGYTWDTANKPDTKILTTKLTNETRIKKVCKDLSRYVVEECDLHQLRYFLQRLNSIYKNKKFYNNLGFSLDKSMVTEENKDKPYVYGIKDCYEYFKNPRHNRQFGRKIIIHLLEKTFAKYQDGKDTFGIIWTLTRELARNKEGYDEDLTGTPTDENHYSETIARPSDVWTYILFKVLGFSMAINKQYEGFIHTAERIQAVIFDRKCYDYDIIDNNRRTSKKYRQERFKNDIFLRLHNYMMEYIISEDMVQKILENAGVQLSIINNFCLDDLNENLKAFYNQVKDIDIVEYISNEEYRKGQTYFVGKYVNLLQELIYEKGFENNIEECGLTDDDIMKMIVFKTDTHNPFISFTPFSYENDKITFAGEEQYIRNASIKCKTPDNFIVKLWSIKQSYLENAVVINANIGNNNRFNGCTIKKCDFGSNNIYSNCIIEDSDCSFMCSKNKFNDCNIYCEQDYIKINCGSDFNDIADLLENNKFKGHFNNMYVSISDNEDAHKFDTVKNISDFLYIIKLMFNSFYEKNYNTINLYYSIEKNNKDDFLFTQESKQKLEEFNEEKIKEYLEKYKDEAIFEILKYIEEDRTEYIWKLFKN